MAKNELKDYTIYKDRPLVRGDGIFCYGDPKGKFCAILTVLTTKPVRGQEISELIFIQLMNNETGEEIKQAQRSGLYEALDLCTVWLDREEKK